MIFKLFELNSSQMFLFIFFPFVSRFFLLFLLKLNTKRKKENVALQVEIHYVSAYQATN